jgi:molybdate transport system permease protein
VSCRSSSRPPSPASRCSPRSAAKGSWGIPCTPPASTCPSGPGPWSWRSRSSPRPFYLRQAIAAFEALDPELTDVARTLGASRTRAFWRVALPLARGGLVAGWVLAFARGVGEFGATIIFAGNVQGRTTTLTLAVYQQLDVDVDVALALGVLLLVLSMGILASYKLIGAWLRSSSTSPAVFAPSPSS